MNIDIRTLALVLIVTNVLQVVVLFLQYLVTRSYRGIGWWTLGFALVALGFVMLILRDLISSALISIIFANGLLVVGHLFAYIGALHFFDRKEHRRGVAAILIVFLLPFLYYTYIDNDITARTVILTAVLCVISLITAHGLFANRTRSTSGSASFLSAVFFAYGCFLAFRSIATYTLAPVDGLFTPSAMQTAGLLAAFVVIDLLTFGFIIMVNQRLNAEMKEAKEHFEEIFNTSPDASLISRLDSGVVAAANEGFAELSGHPRHLAIGKSTLDINLWKSASDRQRFVEAIRDKGRCRNFEAEFRDKDGNQFTGIVSAKIISLNGAPHIMSVTRDITERKRAEERLVETNGRLLEVQETLNSKIQELRQALDQIKTLRGIVPICANCKKIRIDDAYWEQLEVYIRDHTEAELSHGLCPECIGKLYPGLCEKGHFPEISSSRSSLSAAPMPVRSS